MNKKLLYTYCILMMLFVISLCNTTQGIILSDYIVYYALESSKQGLVSAFQSTGNIIGLIIIILLSGKYKKSTMLAISAALIPVIFFIIGNKPALFILLLSYAFFGIVFALWDSLGSSLMADIHTINSSRYMNLLHGFFALGGIIGPLIFQSLGTEGFSWDQMLRLAGIISLVAVFLFTLGLVSAKKLIIENKDNSSDILITDIKTFFREKRNRIILISAFLYGAHQIGITVWMTRYISEYLGTPQWGPAALSLFWVGIAISRLVASRLSLEPAKWIFFGHLISGIVIAIGVLSENGFIMFICCGLSGLAEGAILPMTLDMACNWRKGKSSLGSSMILFVHYVGFIVTPPLIGALIFTYGIKVGMIMPAILSIVATLFTYFLTRKGRERNV
ncbi:MAG TPA: MFS transporter [Defluviitaleaceae bacterium]|jgi:fucose permease|nr:MFS transporter [Defluviitaleaceae bacterium]HPT75498.1 MFS transporter [Defluviitaleaceae bacterium]HQD49728.1 MFS transporter [Defluviitaleaceae bacterium]